MHNNAVLSLDSVTPANVVRIYALTAAQKGLLYQTLLSNSDSLYRTQSRDNVLGPFDAEIFRNALQWLIQRHESLRCFFLHAGLYEPAVVVKNPVSLPWRYHDLTSMSAERQILELDRIASDSLREPLALDSAPLFRVTVAKLSDELSQVIFDIHHLIFDGWSSALFFNELQHVYGAMLNGHGIELPDAGNFGDYAELSATLRPADIRARWAEKLRGFDSPTSLQLANAAVAGSSEDQFTNARLASALDSRTTQKLNDLARKARVTLATIIEAAWALTLANYNDSDDVLVGVTLNGRSSALHKHERTFGMFASVLPMRLKCSPRENFFAWLEAAKKERAWLAANENSPMADIHAASEIPPGIDLFDSMLVFQEFPQFHGSGVLPIHFANYSVHEHSPLPLVIDIFAGDSLNFVAMYSEARLTAESMKQLLDHYLNVLRSMAELKAPEQSILSDIRMLLEHDEEQLKMLSGGPVLEVSEASSLHSLFSVQAARTPDAVAVEDAFRVLNYRQLEQEARGICRFLQARGVGQGEAVGICFQRSCDVYSAILGTLMAGALYVPIDPLYPAARREYMIEDSGLRIILSHDQVAIDFSEIAVEVVNVRTIPGPDNPFVLEQSDTANALQGGAYIMYTSGSTGNAKGVVGTHEATLNRFQWMWETYPFASNEVCCQKTSLSFVDSVWELLGPLLKGVRSIVVSDDELLTPSAFIDILDKNRITRVVLLPSYLAVLLDSTDDISQRLSSLKLCIVSGEPLSHAVAEQFTRALPHSTLMNLYGSTEVSGDATAAVLGSGDLDEAVSIGRPIANLQVFILGRRQQLLPQGAIGEICIAGKGLSVGYHGENVSLNSGKFIPNPYGHGKLFLSGDVGRYRYSGVLEHHGRKDSQIKIRGYRIEPAEIERIMGTFTGVRNALIHAIGDNRIFGYYRVQSGHVVDADALKHFLENQLPFYMVPQALVELDAFPRLPNGKIDKKSLPIPGMDRSIEKVEPRTATERRLAQLWQAVLGGSLPGVFDNFVASGGTSLSGMRFNASVFREFGLTILPRMLLTSDLAQMASYLSDEIVKESELSRSRKENIEPVFIGEKGSRLYGVLHSPTGMRKGPAVLLCSSIGHEYMRLHRGYQMLASDLARKGYFVFRFDLFGMGDSQGEPADATLQLWEQNVADAARFLQQRSSAEKLNIVGVRLGAPIVLGAGLNQVEKTILWDPVCSGIEYLSHLDALHRYAMKNLDRFRFKQYRSHPWERFGYTYSEELSREIKAINAASLLNRISRPVHVVTTDGVTRHGLMGIQSLLDSDHVSHREVSGLNLWFDFDQASYLAFVQEAINTIVDVIDE